MPYFSVTCLSFYPSPHLLQRFPHFYSYVLPGTVYNPSPAEPQSPIAFIFPSVQRQHVTVYIHTALLENFLYHLSNNSSHKHLLKCQLEIPPLHNHYLLYQCFPRVCGLVPLLFYIRIFFPPPAAAPAPAACNISQSVRPGPIDILHTDILSSASSSTSSSSVQYFPECAAWSH